jgi:hypothetical protein
MQVVERLQHSESIKSTSHPQRASTSYKNHTCSTLRLKVAASSPSPWPQKEREKMLLHQPGRNQPVLSRTSLRQQSQFQHTRLPVPPRHHLRRKLLPRRHQRRKQHQKRSQPPRKRESLQRKTARSEKSRISTKGVESRHCQFRASRR